MNEIYKESIVEDDLHIHRAMKKIKAMVGKDRNPLDVAKDWIDEVPHLVAVGIEISEIQELEQNVAKYGSIENWLSAERTKENTSTRKLDDDAREVVERLRGIGTSLMENGACCWTEIVNALGTNSCDDPTLLSTWDNDMTLTRERLIELIERPIHDVDVAALLELADEMEGIAVPPEGDYERGFYDAWCRAHKRILKAVKGAPKPDTEREAEAGEPNRLAHLNLAELAAAEWVEDHGGLDVVRDLAKMDEFVAALAIDLGVSDDVGCGDELRAAIKAELDKRLISRSIPSNSASSAPSPIYQREKWRGRQMVGFQSGRTLSGDLYDPSLFDALEKAPTQYEGKCRLGDESRECIFAVREDGMFFLQVASDGDDYVLFEGGNVVSAVDVYVRARFSGGYSDEDAFIG